MKKYSAWSKRFTSLLLALAMVFSYTSFAEQAQADERTPDQYVFTDYVSTGYHLVSFLNGYNVIAFGNVTMDTHCMGSVLIQGIYEGASTGYSDGRDLPPSYIKGLITAPNAVYNSRNDPNASPLYAGWGNAVTVTESNGTKYYAVNGLTTGYGGRTPAYNSDTFFNFEEAKKIITSDQSSMLKASSKVVTPVNGVITISVGENVTIESLAGVSRINVLGDFTSTVNTTINVTASGDLGTLPELHFNGSQPSVQEQNDAGTSVVWNFPNASFLQLPTQNWVGHVIAPQADVKQVWGNYNGCIICDDLYTSGEGHVYSYNSQTFSWDYVVSVEKVWADGDNADGIRPTSVQVQLMKDGVAHGSPVTLTEASGWYYLWEGLDDDATYTVVELNVPEGYTSTYDPASGVLLNDHEYEKVSISGTKTWSNELNGTGTRPDTITVYLYANGHPVDSVTLSSEGTPTYTFADLPKKANGVDIVYTIHESAVPGYIGTTNGYDLNNQYDVETVDFSGQKIWHDANDQDGLRPTQVTVELLANGVPTGEEHVIHASDGWTYTFTNLPATDAQGNAITYSVKEKTAIAGYTASYSGYDIINTHIPETISLSGTKTWVDDDNNDGKRPESITVILMADHRETSSITVTPDANGNWSYTFTDLDKYHAGTEIKYTVKEVAVEGYTATVDGMNLTNTHVNETIDISGTKTWNDDNDRDGLRPDEITVELYASNATAAVRTATVKADADGSWAYSFTDLPKYDHGTEIVYTVKEAAVAGYTAAYNGYDITNTHETAKIQIGGQKLWDDDNNRDGKRPDSVVIRLLADGVELDSRVVTAADGWMGRFTGLPKYRDGGVEIVYTIVEDAVPGYTTSYDQDSFNVTNSYTTFETIDISGTKTWVDNGDQDGLRPAEITVELYADGVKVDSATVKGSGDTWSYAFTDLPKYKSGAVQQAIVYTVQEAAVPGYTAAYNGYDITNTHITETIDLLGLKVWNDDDNNDGLRPARLTVYLLADGVRTGDYRTTTESRNWYWMFADLAKYRDGGAEIVYSFEEEAVPGYTGPVTAAMTTLPQGYGDAGIQLTNTHVNETVEIAGAKTWNDNNNSDNKRPDSITIRLWKSVANAQGALTHTEVASKNVTAADNWAWDFGEQPKYENGKEIVYTVTEDPVTDYSTTITGYDVTNSYTPGVVSISGVKYWSDNNDQDGLRPDSITVNLLADSVKIAEKTVTAADGWAWLFADLPEYKDGQVGQKVVYTITEETVEGYSSVVDQFDLINSHVPETTTVSGVKTWNDADDQDGARPASITIRLHKTVNGVTTEVRNAVVTANNQWQWNFVELPKYENGAEITYSITEDPVPGYTSAITGYNAANTHETEKTSVSGVKTWNDAGNQDGKRPDTVTIKLLANGADTGKTAIATANGGWAYSFTGLDKYADGKLIVYTVEEADVPAGYTSAVSGYDITNSYTPGETSVSGTKTWLDNNDQDGVRPQHITIRLHKTVNGVTTEVDHLIISAEDNWAWLFTDLPTHEGGQEIAYSITEDPVPGYRSEVDGYNVTNTIVQYQMLAISGTKTWVDDNDRDGIRPASEEGESITVRLYADGVEVKKVTVTPDANGDWTYDFGQLPKYRDGGVEIVYNMVEDPVDGYVSAVSLAAEDDAVTASITNTHEYVMTSISGKKIWNDDNNNDGVRPGFVTINLLADGTEVMQTLVGPRDNWAFSFDYLPKYRDGGTEIVYTVTEDPVAGYTSTVLASADGFTVTNHRDNETVTIAGVKTWHDSQNNDGLRPESITIRLLANGTEIASQVVRPDQYGNWAWNFGDYEKYQNGLPIHYTITEDKVEGYTTIVNGFNVINAYRTATVDVTGSKTWVDADNKFGARPQSITINLLADGVEVAEQTVSAAEGWKWTFAGMPKYNGGQVINYTITEDAVADYTTVVNGFDVVNTYAHNAFTVTKVWEGRNGGVVNLTLYADGVAMDPQPACTRTGDVYTWDGLPVNNAQGIPAVYSAVEQPMTGYTTTYENAAPYADVTDRVYNGGKIINSELTAFTVRKVWSGLADGETKPAIELTLYCNGEAVNVAQPTPDSAGWYRYTDLPAVVDGQTAVYTVVETPVEGYMTTYTTADGKTADAATNGGTITNTKIPQTGDAEQLGLWMALMLLSTAGMVMMLKRRKA